MPFSIKLQRRPLYRVHHSLPLLHISLDTKPQLLKGWANKHESLPGKVPLRRWPTHSPSVIKYEDLPLDTFLGQMNSLHLLRMNRFNTVLSPIPRLSKWSLRWRVFDQSINILGVFHHSPTLSAYRPSHPVWFNPSNYVTKLLIVYFSVSSPFLCLNVLFNFLFLTFSIHSSIIKSHSHRTQHVARSLDWSIYFNCNNITANCKVRKAK
jgi:hypothetical protein